MNKLRLVLDCKYVNDFIQCKSFTQEDIGSVAEQIEEEDHLILIDLKDGFHHVFIKKEHHKFICTYWKGKFNQWVVLPFEVKCASFYFNKIIQPVVKFLRENNLCCSLFVDDFLLMVKKRFATDHKDFMLHALQDLGWSVNWEESKLELGTSCSFIGYNVHSVGSQGLWIQVQQAKTHKLKRHLKYVLKAGTIMAGFLAKIGG